MLVVTSDHGNANPGLNGFGPGYSKTNQTFAHLARATASFTKIRKSVKAAAASRELSEAVSEVLKDTYRYDATTEEARVIGEAIVQKKLPGELAVLQRSWVGVLSQILGNYTGIGFTGTNHTADRTMLTAIGPCASLFRGVNAHVDVFAHFVRLLKNK